MKKIDSKELLTKWHSEYVLTDEQVRQLIKDKIERARLLHEALKKHEFVLTNGER